MGVHQQNFKTTFRSWFACKGAALPAEPRNSILLFSVGADGMTGPAWAWPAAFSLQRGQMKGERWSRGPGLKSSCWHCLEVVLQAGGGYLFFSLLHHLCWDTSVLSFTREKQGNWILRDFIIYTPVFQAVFAMCKVSQTRAPRAMPSRKDYDHVKYFSGISYCAVHWWQLPQHFFPFLTFPKRTSVLPVVPCARDAVAALSSPPFCCFAKSVSSRSSELVTLKRNAPCPCKLMMSCQA